MNLFARTWRSSLGKKYIMAVSGCALFVFVVLHMLGNLQVFLGPEVLNRYGHFLQSTPELVWPARIGLLTLVILHIAAAVKLSLENKKARPVPYNEFEIVAASYASRTMLMSGIIVFVFIVYHLLHFTVQIPVVNLTGEDFTALEDSKQRHDIYRMMILGYSNIWVSAFYVLGIALLCLHLSHGISSMFQSMGWKKRYYAKLIDRFALGAALVIFLGYCSIPVAVLVKWIE